jgi:hypothetical protein
MSVKFGGKINSTRMSVFSTTSSHLELEHVISLILYFRFMLQDYKPMGSDKNYTGLSISGFCVLSHLIPL